MFWILLVGMVQITFLFTFQNNFYRFLAMSIFDDGISSVCIDRLINTKIVVVS